MSPSLTNNLADRLHTGKCKDSKLCLKYLTVKNILLTFDEDLPKIFENTYRFFDRKIDKFWPILQKGVYTYNYKDSWQ